MLKPNMSQISIFSFIINQKIVPGPFSAVVNILCPFLTTTSTMFQVSSLEDGAFCPLPYVLWLKAPVELSCSMHEAYL